MSSVHQNAVLENKSEKFFVDLLSVNRSKKLIVQNAIQAKNTKILKIVLVKKHAKGNGFQALGLRYV